MAAGIPEDLIESFNQLLIQDVARHLPGEPTQPISITAPQEMASLIGAASLLSLSDHFADKDAAYEIATRVAMLGGAEYPGLVRGAELILARLGNFPGRGLLRHRFNEIPRKQPLLELEMRMHEVENSYTDAGGRKRQLTDFQFESIQVFSEYRSVSLSAPTSAGKSFLLVLEVLRRLKKTRPSCIAYVVPTRALIRQVVVDLRKTISDSDLPFPLVRSVPRIVTPEEAPDGVVYVLTQERLLSLIDSEEGKPWLTALVVDEAQEIGSGARGVLLHTAVERVRYRFPSAEVIFASPLAKNPEYLLDLFECSNGRPYNERHSPVSRNLVLVEPGAEDPRVISCTLLAEGKRIALGNRKLSFRFHGLSALRRMALFARNLVTTDDPENCCIVYSNGARAAERIAHHLIRGMEVQEPIDPEVTELIKYVKEYVHPEYGLAEVLPYGVGFHYSNMPGAVRTGVEDLFQRRKLKYLCCTSTLLQGVNLPARHIVMETPTRGKDRPMDRANFLNLAGRAGRLNHEFHGNVWCLRPGIWALPCYEGEPQMEIRSSFDRVMADGGSAIRRVFEDDSPRDSETAVAALGRVFTEFIQQDRAFPDRYKTPANSASLLATQQMLHNLHRTVSLPPEIFTRNSGVHPVRLESLFAFFESEQDLEPFLPIRPNVAPTNQRLREIFQRVQKYLGGKDNDSYRQHAKIASSWIHENPLAQIIRAELVYRRGQARLQRSRKTVNVRNLIYDMIDTIESDIRFRYVKYTRAYHDVLSFSLRRRNLIPQAEALVPLHLYLENGAYRPVPISLMSLGLSRVTALVLANRVILPNDATPEQCLSKCKEAIRNAPGLKLSPTMLREVQALIG